MSRFKFEGFAVGQTIRAHDFEPISGREECSVIGEIEQVNVDGTASAPYAHYVILCTDDVWRGVSRLNEYSRIGRRVTVPMESMMDWDDRVTLLQPPQESHSFRLVQRTRDCVLYLSGWSQHRLQPTFTQTIRKARVWKNDAAFAKWKARHPSNEWDFITLEKVAVPAPVATQEG